MEPAPLLPLDFEKIPPSWPRWAQPSMDRAVELAGSYDPSPNPRVGCVIVSPQGEMVGEGAHERFGGPHAEIQALRMAGAKASHAAVYVTLEPCSHYGKTPPCADALVEARVGSVVVGVVDPDRRVLGRGLAILERAGIPTWVGLGRRAVVALNPEYHQLKAACSPES